MRPFGVQAQGGLILLVAIVSVSGVDPSVLGHVAKSTFSLLGLLGLVWSACKERRLIHFFIGATGVIGLIAVYYYNPTHRWEEGVGALPIDHISLLPGSAFPLGTQTALAFAVTAAITAGLAIGLKDREVLRGFGVASVVGAVTALFVLAQRLTPHLFPVFEWTGFFVYENHFAAFANLILPIALACGRRAQYRAFQSGQASSPAGLFYWMVFLLTAAVMLSRSRAGLFITGGTITAFILMQIRLRRRYPFLTPPLVWITKVGLGAGVMILGLGLIGILHEEALLRSLGQELSFRSQTLLDTLSMWRDYRVWGTGPGSFAAVFPYYQSLPIGKYFFSHAHCEPLEFLAEYGVLGGGLIALAVAWIFFFGRCRDVQNTHSPSFMELEGFGLILALCGMGLHSLIDFPLRHPVNALLTWAWVGILVNRLSGCSVMKILFSRNKVKRPDGDVV